MSEAGLPELVIKDFSFQGWKDGSLVKTTFAFPAGSVQLSDWTKWVNSSQLPITPIPKVLIPSWSTDTKVAYTHIHIIKNKKTGSLCLQYLTCYTKPSWVQHPLEPHVLPTPGNVFISFSPTRLMLSSEIYKLATCRWGVEVLLFHCLIVDLLHSQNHPH